MTTRKKLVKPAKIEGTSEAWEAGKLGLDKAHAKLVSGEELQKIDEAADLQMISIRLQKPLIDALKNIARLEGLVGYQPLIRRVLTRFVDAEMKRLLRDQVKEMEARQRLAAGKAGEKEHMKQMQRAA